MASVLEIRKRLAITQKELADALSCTQGNISHYERGQTFPPDAAQKLIEFAASRGVDITFNDIYATASAEAA